MNVHENVDLKPYTTFGVAGIARWFAEAKNETDIDEAFKWARERKESILILGGGSNVAFADGVINKFVLKITNEIVKGEDNKILCGAGTKLSKLIEVANAHGLAGVEAMAGIPGTVGGAIVGNASAYGQSISDNLVRVLVMIDGKKLWMHKEECEFEYHNSIFERKQAIVVQAEFEFKIGDKSELEKKSADTIDIRSKKYPPDMKFPGCFFRNVWAEKVPQNVLEQIPNLKDYFGKVPAWYFLNEVGAKGMKLGGLRVTDFHGNLVTNEGNATFTDVVALADELKKRVYDKFGVKLEEEVRFVS